MNCGIQNSKREGGKTPPATRCFRPSQCISLLRGPSQTTTLTEGNRFSPLSMPPLEAAFQTRVHSFQVFVFKQGLIKLHGIQKKEMYQRIQPETRLYIVGREGAKSLLIGWGSTVIGVELQNKSYNKLFFKKKINWPTRKDGQTHTLTHATHVTLVFYSVLTMTFTLVPVGKDKG